MKYKFSLLVDEKYDYIHFKDKLNDFYYCIQFYKKSKRFKELYTSDKEDLYKESIIDYEGNLIRLYN